MEFKFRAVDDRQLPLFSPSSTAGCISGQPLRATNYQIIYPRQNPELMRNEMVRREIEKQWIREKIITEEIARPRELEAEVRRELMMEREMKMRIANGGGGLSFQERQIMQFDNRVFEERFPFPWLHSQRLSESLVLPYAKFASENKLILLAKPEPNICGSKWNAMASRTGGAVELLDALSRKKPKEEWSCALCQVSATSESGLNEHLQGKKHKAKEARLRESKMAKNPPTVQMLKENPITAVLKLEAKAKGESLEVDGSEDNMDRKREKVAENQSTEWKDELAKRSKKRRLESKQREERTEEYRINKKFKFWCGHCQVGAYSAVVMEAHEKGRKHLAQQQELGQKIEACETITKMESSSKGDEKAKHEEDEAEG